MAPDTARKVLQVLGQIDVRYRTLIFTAAYCGLRVGELGYFRVESLDLLRGTLEVRGSLAEVRGRIIEGPTTTGKVRTVVVPRFLASMLADDLPKYASGGYVFSSRDGGGQGTSRSRVDPHDIGSLRAPLRRSA